MTPLRIEGLRVAITGAARGIGLATARALHDQGATVVLGDLDRDTVEQAAAHVGRRAQGLRLDVADLTSFTEFVDQASAGAPLDVLVNNAGIMPIGRFVDQPESIVRRAVDINLLGVLTGMQIALPPMLARGSGHVVNIASTAGKAAIPGGVVYCATKAAVVAATEAARLEYVDSGVRLSCVIPHFTATELVSGTTATKGVPMIEAEDVAAAIVDVIRLPRPEVYVPRAIGRLLASQHFTPRKITEAVNRRMGAYDTFLRFDTNARAAYDTRIAGGDQVAGAVQVSAEE